jgi:hypothetical protein
MSSVRHRVAVALALSLGAGVAMRGVAPQLKVDWHHLPPSPQVDPSQCGGE